MKAAVTDKTAKDSFGNMDFLSSRKAAIIDKSEKTTQDAPGDKVEINKNIEGAAQPLAAFSIVEDHIKDNHSPPQKDSNSMGETIKKIEIASDFIEENVKIEEKPTTQQVDDLNDREDADQQPQIKIPPLEIKENDLSVKKEESS